MNSRAKGQRGELSFRDYLRERGYEGAERGQQRSGGADSPDVRGGPAGFHFEVKYTRTLRLYDAVDQAVRDAGGKSVPVVAHLFDGRKPGSRGLWLAVIRMDDLFELIQLKDVNL